MGMKVGSHEIELSNEDKVLFPREGYTKGEVIEYYDDLAERMIPYLADRPLTLRRFPDGITKDGFYQKVVQDYYPDWIRKAKVSRKEGGHITHVICNDAPTLVYLANQACITFHPWLSRRDKPDKPDRMVFDLDPGDDDKSNFSNVKKGAGALRAYLEDNLEIESWVMTTGSRGLHIVIPLRRNHDYDTVRSAAQTIARKVARDDSDNLTVEVRKNKREGRIFIDTARNAYAQTSVAPYSLRARPGAPVATPLEWSELGSGELTPTRYNLGNIRRRLAQRDDPWKTMSPQSFSSEKLEQILRRDKAS